MNRIVVEVKGSEELYNKMKELVRRNPETMRIMEDNTEKRLIIAGELEIDLQRQEVRVGNKKIILTSREFEILVCLASHPGEVFSHCRIYETVWKKKYFQDSANITAHIGHIRKKIEPDCRKPIYIQTVHGVGYRFGV